MSAHAQTAIRQAVPAELDAFLGKHDDTDDLGRRNMVRNGHQPEREALTALFGESVRGLSPSTISRLKSVWSTDCSAFCERDW